MSASCVPDSTTREPWSTTMKSAMRTVLKRWDTRMSGRRRISTRYARAGPRSLVQLLRIRPRQLHEEPSDLLAHRLHVLPSLLRGRGRGAPDAGVVRHLAPLARRPGPPLSERLDRTAARAPAAGVRQR